MAAVLRSPWLPLRPQQQRAMAPAVSILLRQQCWASTRSSGPGKSRTEQSLSRAPIMDERNMNPSNMPAMLIPGTFIAQPLSRCPRNPRDFLTYQWGRIKTHVFDLYGAIAMKLVSIPKTFGRPQFKIGRRQIIPTAKAMHRQMAESMASGDKETLRKICTPSLYNQLSGVLSKRKASERVSWELVKYNRTLTHPKLASYKCVMIPQAPNYLLIQAIVAIASTQKLAKYDKRTNELIAGSAKVREQTEYVVLTKWLDRRTWKDDPWRIWGSVEETTLEDMLQQEKDIAALNRERVHKL